jgi:rfaE bifunctional protein nucleotidyltransferase chain/domain
MREQAPSHKILSHDQLLAIRARARAEGRAVVQCHGCFDIVHPGHVRHLRYARALGDILLVSITGDIEMKKGVGRPLIPEELRAENLAALDCVDWVYVEQRPTAAEMLAEVKPDVYVKGKEYESNNDPRFKAERKAVQDAGGRIVFSSGDVVFSSTALIAAMEASVDPFHTRLVELTEKPELNGTALNTLVGAFRGKRLVVVGESILDTYILCDRPHIAGESPVMTLRPLERRHYDGAAAVIARHAAAMGARPILITALPDDAIGASMRQRLTAEGVEVRAIKTRTPLAEKQRFLVGTQKVFKLDLLEPIVLDAAEQDRLVAMAAEAGAENGGCHAAIVADFGQGLFTPRILSALCKALRPSVGILTGDVSGRRSSLRAMRDMDLLTPSESEARDALGLLDQGLPVVAWKLLAETRSRAAIVTLGPDGLIAFDRLPDAEAAGPEKSWQRRVRGEHIPSFTPHAVDPLGCGDSLLVAATLALACGGGLLAGAFIGAAAAAVQAQRMGNIPISAADLRQSIARIHSARLAFAVSEVIDAAAINAPRPILKAS